MNLPLAGRLIANGFVMHQRKANEEPCAKSQPRAANHVRSTQEDCQIPPNPIGLPMANGSHSLRRPEVVSRCASSARTVRRPQAWKSKAKTLRGRQILGR